MAFDEYIKIRQEILQIEFPKLHDWDYETFQKWKNEGLKRAPSGTKPIFAKAFARYLQVRNFSPHEAIYFHLYKCAERDGQVEEEERLNHDGSLLCEKDYDFWCKADHWSHEEFIGLIVGRQPKRIITMLEYRLTPKTDCGQRVQQLKTLLVRARDKRFIDWDASPRSLIAWAKTKQIELPEHLLNTAEKYGLMLEEEEVQSSRRASADFTNVFRMKPDQPVPTPIASSSTATKEKESLLKMVIGMAVEGYAYDPDKRRNPTAKEVSDDLAKNGISLDEDTIRKYLKAGAELLPGDVKPNSPRKTNSGTA